MSHRLTRTALAGGVAVAAATLALSVAGASAAASTPTTYNAIGAVRSIVASSTGLVVKGWAGDLNAGTANTPVVAVVDGKQLAAQVMTSVPMPSVSKKHHLGPTPGFSINVPVSSGNHTVCVVAKDVGPGTDKVLDCVLTPLGRTVTSHIMAKHSPRGDIQHGWASRHSVVFSGWADDPDDLLEPSIVTLYVDGSAVASQQTTHYPWPRPAGSALHPAFSFRVPASTGAHMGCLWIQNVGIGRNTFLGCKAVDTRSHQPVTNPLPVATAAAIVKQAKTHIGQKYVYGAEGPKTFDCSGLVTYSYGKFGWTLPHQSGMQFALAHPIAAGKAVPGDLVFYHDAYGTVYHVGIYTKPGMTVAAIDTQEGVNYQAIYSSVWATYGSFVHSSGAAS